MDLRGKASTGPITEQQLAKYSEIAARYGIRYERVGKWEPDFNWKADGVIRIQTSDRSDVNDMFAHDLAHYLVATPKERLRREFGLGTSPMASEGLRPATSRNGGRVEEQASALGIYLQLHVEGRTQALFTYEYHNWPDTTGTSFLYISRFLLKKGFLTWHEGRLMPTALVRMPDEKDIFVPRKSAPRGKRRTSKDRTPE